MKKLLSILAILVVILGTGLMVRAQQPLPTPALGQLPPPGYGAIGAPGAVKTATPWPTVTPTPMWRAIYYVRGYTPLWSQPAQTYFVPFTLVTPGTYLMVQEEGNWLVILNCSTTRTFAAPCGIESLYVQNDWNVVRQ